MIAEAMDKVGKEGVIPGRRQPMTTELKSREGMRFDKGYIPLSIQSGWKLY